MTAIGIVDDRKQDRESIAETVTLSNEAEGWTVIDTPPLANINEYPAWINENKICALIIDELLDEAIIFGKAVDYKGHDLVDFIRARFSTLPIYIVTAHSTDASVQDRFKDVEGIIDRIHYANTYRNYVPRIIRSAQQYLSVFQDELTQLTNYATKAALGETISPEQHSLIEAIRGKLGVAYSIDPITDTSNWINAATELINKIEKLRNEIEEKTGKR